jgi:hypothetical protein
MHSATSQKNQRPLFLFLLVWLVLNCVQAVVTGIDGDEAYYWTYSQHLQWGYFDHPPMVALSIKLGEWFGHGYLFTRLGTILFSTATVYFGFKALPERLQNTKWYVLIFASVLIFHVYSFVTTPDAPLLFFTALFFYAYKLYLKEDRFQNILFLSLSIAGLFYSKYHGVLPVFFTFLSNPKLVFKRSAWLVVILVALSFIPHLWWQYVHDWPTIRYHLFERNRGTYKIEKTSNYILGQLLIFGPLTTIVALIFFLKNRFKADVYFRAHLFTFFGVLIFFLLSSFKKNIEPHWTLTAGISFVVLVMDLVDRSKEGFKKIFSRLAIANIVLIVIARIILALPNSPAKKIDRFQVQIYSHSWSDSLYKKAAGTPVVFIDNYTYPSLYKYYHPDQMSTCYSSVYYRKNNYSLQDQKEFNNKAIYTVRQIRVAQNDIEVKSSYVPTFLHKVDSFKAITGLKIRWMSPVHKLHRGEKLKINLELFNPLDFTIDGKDLFLDYTFSKSKTENYTSEFIPVNEQELKPGYKRNYTIELHLPDQPGKYQLIFSFDQLFVGPTFASPFYEVEVD